MVYARSPRPTLALGIAFGAAGLVFASAAAWRLLADPTDGGAVLFAIAAAFAIAFSARELLRLRGWPRSRLVLFRDRLVLIQGRNQLGAAWDGLELISLADQSEWGSLRWPEVRLTNRLTLRLTRAGSISFRPRAFGLEPIACRDLILSLRDQRGLRAQLPEFDSELDLVRR